jgi:hypothetical protein
VEKFHARKSAAEDAGRGGKQNRKSKNTQRREARAKRLEEQTKSLG